jgi:hypothetical protein
LLRRTVMRTGAGLAAVAVAAMLLVIGLGFCLWAAYLCLVVQVGTVNAALMIGVLMILMAGLMAWIASRLNR